MAQDAAKYPEQMVRVVVPFSAGSMTDLLARVIADKLQQRWNKDVVVENRPGLAGTSSVAKGAADGYTLMLTSNGHTVISHLNKNLAFDPIKDFVGVTQVATTPLIMVVPPDSPAKSVKDLIELARAKPGALNYSSAGLGSTTGIAGALFKQVTQTDIVHVPFKGLPETHTAIIRGDVAMGFSFFAAAGDLVQSGKVRALAVTGPTRLSVLPDVPTFKEAGLPEFQYDSWFGILAPAGTPQAIVAKGQRRYCPGRSDAGRQSTLRAARRVPRQHAARPVQRDHQGRHRALFRALQGRELGRSGSRRRTRRLMRLPGDRRQAHHFAKSIHKDIDDACRRARRAFHGSHSGPSHRSRRHQPPGLPAAHAAPERP